jgi:hypothetical protein
MRRKGTDFLFSYIPLVAAHRNLPLRPTEFVLIPAVA